MRVQDYQDFCSTTVIYTPANALTYLGLGLGSEAGEVQDHIAKYLRDNKPLNVTAMGKELGDCLWMIANLCTHFGLDMGEVMSTNVAKLSKRKEEGKLSGSGDER